MGASSIDVKGSSAHTHTHTHTHMENAVLRRDAGTKVDLFRNVDAVRHVPFFSFLFLSFSLFFKKRGKRKENKTEKIFLFHFHI